jgi:hypothetical protein
MQFGALEGNGVSTEKGIDLRVPYHTPITPLFPGVVRSVATGPYGQEVDVTGLLNGQQVTASYVHLDEALVSPGQAVGLGSEIGLSGGQNQGGFHPASPAYSTYPHIEFSLWPAGTTPYGGQPYDPMNYIEALQANPSAVLGVANPAGAPGSSGASNWLQSFLQGGATQSVGESSPIINIQPPDIAGGLRSAGNSLLGVLGGVGPDAQSKLHDLLWRALLWGLAIILVIVVAVALTSRGTAHVTDVVINSRPVQDAARLSQFAR